MIIGREQLKQMYPELLDEQYQPAGSGHCGNSC